MDFEGAELLSLKTRQELISLAVKKNIDISKALDKLKYETVLIQLQTELVALQQWIHQNKMRVVVIFEGRDAAGKGGSIKRFTEHLNPRYSNRIALPKPTDIERGQWYFRRYIKELPNPGEMVFFDRSWYNRAVVEPVMGFCNKKEYNQFMAQVPEFEHMLYEDGVKVIKFWFSISKDEQNERFEARLKSPLKRWKYSPVDMKGQELWDSYTKYKELMFSRTHTNYSPWIIVKTNDKKQARLESMRYVLSQFDFPLSQKSNVSVYPDPNIIMRYHRSADQIDI